MSKAKAHVLDGNSARRAELARTLIEHGAHAEIYESVDEMVTRPPKSGIIIADHDALCLPTGESRIAELSSRTGLPVSIYTDAPVLSRVVRAMLDGAINYLSWPISCEQR